MHAIVMDSFVAGSRDSSMHISPAVFVLALFAATPLAARGQDRAAPSPRHHRYIVTGTMQGEAMDPWTSALSVSDSAVNDTRVVSIHYDSRESPAGFLYRYSALLEWSGTRGRAEWIGAGRSHSTCVVDLASGALTGKVNGTSTPTPVHVAGPAIPDFAIAAFFSTQPLATGDTVRFTMFRCLAHRGDAAIDTVTTTAIVTDGTAERGGQLEPVWTIAGTSPYAFVAAISKADRTVLRTVTPQGSVGYSTDTIALPAAKEAPR